MKMLKKEHIVKKRQIEHLKTERFVLVSTEPDWESFCLGKYHTPFYC